MAYKYPEYVNVRINVCICKLLYRKLGKQKADIFIKSKDRKTAYLGFEKAVSSNETSINESKVNRILQGYTKSKFTKDEVVTISKTFGIDEKYFEIGNNMVINISGITIENWKQYLNVQYKCKGDFKIPVFGKEDNILKKVDEAIEQVASTGNWRTLGMVDPVYRILHFFSTGETFVGDDEKTRVRQKITGFEKLTYDDFMLLGHEEINKHIGELEKQLQLMKAIVIVEEKKITAGEVVNANK